MTEKEKMLYVYRLRQAAQIELIIDHLQRLGERANKTAALDYGLAAAVEKIEKEESETRQAA